MEPKTDISLFKTLSSLGSGWTLLILSVAVIGGAWTVSSRVPATASTGAGSPPPSPREGFTAPDFTLELLGGGDVTLSDLQGKVVLINIWASWCPPCRDEMPAIEKVYQSYQGLGLEVLAVNTTNQDRETDAKAFVESLGLTFPVPLDRTGEVSKAYQLRALPTTFFVDRKGVIRSVVIGGPMRETTIQSKVEELLSEGG